MKFYTGLFLGFLALFLALGTWQLRRADEKRALIAKQNVSSTTEAIQLSAGTEDNAEALRYRNVKASGHFDVARQFLIDNQHSAGRVGYYVLTPFILEGQGRAVLVNRGWVPLHDRKVLPDVSFTDSQRQVTGRLNKFPGVGIKLEGADVPAEGWPSVVQVADSRQLAKKLPYPIFSFQIELDKNLPDGYQREWQAATIMQPEQHIAYAVQWFALAITVTIIFIVYSFKKK